jgi:hypothetical protein
MYILIFDTGNNYVNVSLSDETFVIVRGNYTETYMFL